MMADNGEPCVSGGAQPLHGRPRGEIHRFSTKGNEAKIWKRYEMTVKIINQDQKDPFTDHLNSIHPTGSIQLANEPEVDKTIHFLDALVTRTPGGSMKVKVYRKKTTDQYLNFGSHHPLIHKLGVIRTLYERSDNVITDVKDRQEDSHHINKALQNCGYPPMGFRAGQRHDGQHTWEGGEE